MKWKLKPKTNTQSNLEERADQPQPSCKKQQPEGTEQWAVVRKKRGPKPNLSPRPKCSVDGCDRCATSRKPNAICLAHSLRLQKTGSTQPDIPISKSRHGARNSRWKGGEIDDGHGRIVVYSPNHPHPSRCGTHVYRYRLVMEKHLGRFLDPKEIVHHKNGNNTDDRIENLEVMRQSEHARLHSQTRKRNSSNQYQ